MDRIELTKAQEKELNRLWWIYGNSGPKCTLQNHKLIQGFLHYQEDRRLCYIQGNKNIKSRHSKLIYEKTRLTDECLEAVNRIVGPIKTEK